MMQLILIILTKKEETIRYCETFRYSGTTLSNIVANDLTHVSVPIEDGSNMPLRGAALSCPLMPLTD
jgi:hypothetical protein